VNDDTEGGVESSQTAYRVVLSWTVKVDPADLDVPPHADPAAG
jgi:hypothetical protein